jgi:hypothetical protein
VEDQLDEELLGVLLDDDPLQLPLLELDIPVSPLVEAVLILPACLLRTICGVRSGANE